MLTMPILHQLYDVGMSGEVICVAPIDGVEGGSVVGSSDLEHQLLLQQECKARSDTAGRDLGMRGEGGDSKAAMFGKSSEDLLRGC